MNGNQWSKPLRTRLPLILIRGFGGVGVEDEKRVAYQGFNDGTVYPQKRGENYIYEGLILRFIKSRWQYHDATNVVGYYSSEISVTEKKLIGHPDLQRLDEKFFVGDKVVIDPAMAVHLLRSAKDLSSTLWVFRYYDLNDRNFSTYGKALVRLIDFILELAVKDGDASKPKVNIIAHSMGGLLVREAVQRTYPNSGRSADDYINKIVTLGTPHQGISFQLLKNWVGIEASKELEHFNPDFQKDKTQQVSFTRFHQYFPLERLLTAYER